MILSGSFLCQTFQNQNLHQMKYVEFFRVFHGRAKIISKVSQSECGLHSQSMVDFNRKIALPIFKSSLKCFDLPTRRCCIWACEEMLKLAITKFEKTFKPIAEIRFKAPLNEF